MSLELSREQQTDLEQAMAELEAISDSERMSADRHGELGERLANLSMLGGFDTIEVLAAYTIASDPQRRGPRHATHVFFAATGRIERSSHRGKVHSTEDVGVYQIAFASLGGDCGHVQMRPERFADVVADWFKKVDVDFEEAPEFSDNYYVVADDPERFRSNISVELLREIGHLSDLYIEILGAELFVTTSAVSRTRDVAKLAGLSLEAAASEPA
jgi:hypothetical protein